MAFQQLARAGRLARGLVSCGLLLMLLSPALGQRPELPDEEKFGRPADESSLSFCIDRRDPGWEVDQRIGTAIAESLLLTPKIHFIEAAATREDLDNLYRHLRADCRLYFGFKLLPEVYPDWLTISRPIYQVGYVFITANPDWQELGDIPRSEALGPTLFSAADLQLVQFLGTLPANERWRRFPMSSDEVALQAVVDGNVAAALVWAPSFAALAKERPEFQALRPIAATPLPDVRVAVGAVMLGGDAFLRNSIDGAIAALSADGTIAGILADSGVPAAAVQ